MYPRWKGYGNGGGTGSGNTLGTLERTVDQRTREWPQESTLRLWGMIRSGFLLGRNWMHSVLIWVYWILLRSRGSLERGSYHGLLRHNIDRRFEGVRRQISGIYGSAPAPEIVRSIPPSPASTITPDTRDRTPPPLSPLMELPRRRHGTPRDEGGDQATPRLVTSSLVDHIDPPPVPHRHTSPSRGSRFGSGRLRRDSDSGLTYRGMEVQARLNDANPPPRRDRQQAMLQSFMRSIFGPIDPFSGGCSTDRA